MDNVSIEAIATEQARKAAESPNGRAAETIYGGHEKVLRQTIVALAAGNSLSEHQNPGEATLLVLQGHVRLVATTTTIDGHTSDLIIIPESPHSLEAVTDAVVLLTVAKLP